MNKMFFLIGFILSLLSLVEAQFVPNITLPWGTYEATNTDDTFWHIPNIRFGKDTSLNRFQAPQIPDGISNTSQIQNQTYGPACIQIALKAPNCSSTAKPAPFPGGIGSAVQSEDCLFLDVYLPKNENFNISSPTTPVVVWIYGGAYVFGSKGGDQGDNSLGPLYTGQALIEAAQKLSGSSEVIFVAGNYRLGAFGWLAGPTMQAYGQPNAALYDQELLLNWVQQYIYKLGGDNSSISVWGESAGAGSILHHLVKQDDQPLPFQTALLQSPAYEWQWDNSTSAITGTMQSVFDQFAFAAGCGNQDSASQFECIQNADLQNELIPANQDLWDGYRTRGLFPFGPAVDNGSYTLLPPIALASNKFKKLDAIVVSHVFNESGTFTPKGVPYDEFLGDFIPQQQDETIRTSIDNFYSNITDELTRLQTTIRDVSFTCNTRYLFDAYAINAGIPTWMMQYSTGASYEPTKDDIARHASDLIPSFWYSEWDIDYILKNDFCVTDWTKRHELESDITKVSEHYQTYLANYATSANPNTELGSYPYWSQATLSSDGEDVTNVLDFGLHSRNISDQQNTATTCNFWLAQAQILVANAQARNANGQEKLRLQDPARIELK